MKPTPKQGPTTIVVREDWYRLNLFSGSTERRERIPNNSNLRLGSVVAKEMFIISQKSSETTRSREPGVGREWPGLKLLRKLKREMSTPAIPPGGGRSKGQKLFATRSSDNGDRRKHILDKASTPSSLANVHSRGGGPVFGGRNKRGVRGCVGNDLSLRQICSEDSSMDGAENAPSPMAEESSRQLSKLWEEDPDSKSGMFMSLLEIENYD